jgi:hypothetical protein
MTRILTTAAVALFCGAVLVAAARDGGQTTQTTPREDYTSGAYMFKAFCASCHGDTGRGDGPVRAVLTRDPGDLRLLAQRNNGVFPRDRVRASIDGRTLVAGHERGMPVWGTVFQSVEATERDVARRIDALVSHVESMQTAKPE